MGEVVNLSERTDTNRTHDLGQALLTTIRDWQDKHHAEKVSVSIADAEVLEALVSVLGFTAASVECNDCRAKLCEIARHQVVVMLQDAAGHPIPLGEDDAGDGEPHVH
jgi:hypothetical protein